MRASLKSCVAVGLQTKHQKILIRTKGRLRVELTEGALPRPPTPHAPSHLHALGPADALGGAIYRADAVSPTDQKSLISGQPETTDAGL